ncbi:uncharacterized protein G2W53_039693 [Senna tora]|uniref:Uncharacterized protein n=1 Tax=Senna tora TaxID=362788 RepID=A0A834W303_9FABA|nr:uncharacterized protein G2W53_039693 [Senna tora]
MVNNIIPNTHTDKKNKNIPNFIAQRDLIGIVAIENPSRKLYPLQDNLIGGLDWIGSKISTGFYRCECVLFVSRGNGKPKEESVKEKAGRIRSFMA